MTLEEREFVPIGDRHGVSTTPALEPRHPHEPSALLSQRVAALPTIESENLIAQIGREWHSAACFRVKSPRRDAKASQRLHIGEGVEVFKGAGRRLTPAALLEPKILHSSLTRPSPS
jgi:hypothetical protein